MNGTTNGVNKERDLHALLDALDSETLQILASMKDSVPQAVPWALATLPLGSRAAMHAYGAIVIGEVIDASLPEDPDTLRLREIKLLPLGERVIEAAAARISSGIAESVRRRIAESLAQ